MADDQFQTNPESSGDGKGEAEVSSCVQKLVAAVDELGYETPSSEDHRIPPVDWSRPPPPPRKRKRLSISRKKVQAMAMFEDGVLADEELEAFFRSVAAAESRAPPAARTTNRRAKKRRLRD